MYQFMSLERVTKHEMLVSPVDAQNMISEL
jgi:hypothetical protein